MLGSVEVVEGELTDPHQHRQVGAIVRCEDAEEETIFTAKI
jgi:hypothetical protein